MQSNLKVVDYLHVTLNLTTGRYYPFRKPENNLLYINAKSNPPSTIRQIPTSISTTISGLSHDQDEFDKQCSEIQWVQRTNTLYMNTKEEKNPETYQETSPGLTHRTVRMFKQTSLNHSFAWLINISQSNTKAS